MELCDYLLYQILSMLEKKCRRLYLCVEPWKIQKTRDSITSKRKRYYTVRIPNIIYTQYTLNSNRPLLNTYKH
jgi:hypothetical protein